jgi:hypothetical protein
MHYQTVESFEKDTLYNSLMSKIEEGRRNRIALASIETFDDVDVLYKETQEFT